MPSERLVQEHAGALVVPSVVRDLAECLEGRQGLGVVRTRGPALLLEGAFEGRSSRGVLAASLMDEAEYPLQLRPHRRCFPQPNQRTLLGAPQELSDRHAIAVRPHRWVRRLEEIDQQPDDLFGGVALQLGHATLLGQDSRLPGGDGAERRQAGEEYGCRQHGQPVPPHELADAVAQRVRLREHGSALQEPADLLAELARRHVSSIGLRSQRGQDDAVQVAAEPAPQLPPFGGPPALPDRFAGSRRRRRGALWVLGSWGTPGGGASRL